MGYLAHERSLLAGSIHVGMGERQPFTSEENGRRIARNAFFGTARAYASSVLSSILIPREPYGAPASTSARHRHAGSRCSHEAPEIGIVEERPGRRSLVGGRKAGSERPGAVDINLEALDVARPAASSRRCSKPRSRPGGA
jgi:hypothetical protein